MIRPEELRIGNLVNVPNKDQCPFRIDAFEYCSHEFIKVAMKNIICGTEVHPITWYGNDLEPIPLTEELLLRLGFDLVVKEGNQAEFRVYQLNEITYNTNHGWWWRHQLTLQPKYLHQLQNLYFALTGKELTLN